MSTPIRDGKPLQIYSSKLVVGDVIQLEMNTVIPADCLVLDASHQLMVTEGFIGGWRVKTPGCCLLSGSNIEEGIGTAIVCAVGTRTMKFKLM